MLVVHTTDTIAEYCRQMRDRGIIVNPDYQRSNKVWPPAARSFLIDTILGGYPMPKISLSQRTDLKTRTTLKEIVDGQQRSTAIRDFYDGKFRITGQSAFSGKTFDQLDPEDQQRFVDYQLSLDLFVGATPAEIREVFRRMNSYTIPLNPQETRHAVYQGAMKWFISSLTKKYSQALLDMGVLTERSISRMDDASLLCEIVLALRMGLDHASEKKLDNFYDKYEKLSSVDFAPALTEALDAALMRALDFSELHNGPLMKPYMFYSLVLALCHVFGPVQQLEGVFHAVGAVPRTKDEALSRLSVLAEAKERPDAFPDLHEFTEAAGRGTNRRAPREIRFKQFCGALAEEGRGVASS